MDKSRYVLTIDKSKYYNTISKEVFKEHLKKYIEDQNNEELQRIVDLALQ
jgi:predicted house-cleaning noncanonical NTP pyrophosphatase (MazG superfamily)